MQKSIYKAVNATVYSISVLFLPTLENIQEPFM